MISSEHFENYLSQFDDLFARSEPRSHFRLYERGLMSAVDRKNGWQLAEAVGLEGPQQLQRLLNQAAWDADEMMKRVRQIIKEELGFESGIGVLDESGFPKEGRRSVGVKRQYCGRLGKVDNCQMGVFLGYVTPTVHAMLDRALYLPEDWCDDLERREQAKVPPGVTFKTKIELGMELLQRSWDEGIPMKWVLADTFYGKSSILRSFIHQAERYYVMQIPKSLLVLVDGSVESHPVSVLAQGVMAEEWHRWALPGGEKGAIIYDWLTLRVTPDTDYVGEQWVIFRRSVTNPSDIDYFLSNAPVDTDEAFLFRIASERHRVEDIIKEAKHEVGLADYEVRYWPSWYRHITLALVALLFLNLHRHQPDKKNATFLVADAQRL